MIRTYRYLLCILVIVSSLQLSAQEEKEYVFRSILFYNVENLFDTINDPHTNDDSHTPEGRYKWSGYRYRNKLENIAKTLSDFSAYGLNATPDIIGLCEIENRQVLEDLVQNHYLVQHQYGIVHTDSPDQRGIDVGLLYKKSVFQPTSYQHHQLLLINENEEREYTRDQLVIGGLLGSEKLFIIVNHWPSRRGGQQKSNAFRISAARLSLKIIDSIQKLNQNSRILLMGDFNDNPKDPSIKSILKARREPNSENLQALFNPMERMFEFGLGSLAYRDQWSLFDQIMITMNLVIPANNKYRFWTAGIFQPEYLITAEGKYKGYPLRTYAGGQYTGGYSDHFPVYVLLIRKL